MISHAGQILNPSSSYSNNGVLLQIVSDSGNVSRNFHAVGQTNPGNLSQGRVRFFGSNGSYLSADSPFERRWIKNRPVLFGVKTEYQSRRLGFRFGRFSRTF